ncbi:vacuolar protein sorting-associated [Plasmopara halstedii]|uniref:Vacuolar protein sorting-associated n=1 Tax=Plasmopara halstedii TaxID=4781 RepID=A0A0P1AIZ5_PLAHL|nr:vacuolar protein sorting-associated [Plasmopara halstedii]CEG40897.1 vacuolar protein sorting-associated [Plasmopara halstedii]|eukprot:XP_024577266.1 vacuolar protein sorting-associated [Plasmopara halstedii]
MIKLPPLDTGLLPLQKLREENESALTNLLDHLGTDQLSLVLTKRLASLLTHVFVNGLGVLNCHHVVECLELVDDNVMNDTSVVYLAFAHTQEARAVFIHAQKLVRGEDKQRKRRLILYVVGKWTSMLDQILDESQLRDRFETGELAMSFFPLDTDILTLGLPRTLYECEVEGNQSSLVDMAAALNVLQQVYGNFQYIKYKGKLAMLVCNQMMEMNARGSGRMNNANNTKKESSTTATRSRLDTLILLDRSVDYASIFSTPLTYEGVLDEIMDIQDGFVMVPPDILRADNNHNDASVPLAMNSTDETFQQIRDKHIHTVPAALNTQAMAIKGRFNEFQRVSITATSAEVNEFVKTVPKMKTSQQAIEQHLNLLECLKKTTSSKAFRDQWHLERKIMDQADGALEMIEDLIYRYEDSREVLRLLCLYCVVNDGMMRHDLEHYKMTIVKTYGYELFFLFSNLERLGILYERRAGFFGFSDTTSSFHSVANSLSVIDVDVNIYNPENTAFVTSGYGSISARLVEEILKHGDWRRIDHVMRRLPGPRAELRLNEKDSTESRKQKIKKKTVIVVAFVGGVTFLEIAALRWMASFCKTVVIIFESDFIN